MQNFKEMKRILLLTDFSENSRKATTSALRLFGPKNHYYLLNIYYTPIFGASRGEMYPLIVDDSKLKLAQELDKIAKIVDTKDYTIDPIAEICFDEGVIINFIRTKGIDYVIMGKGGSHTLIGSFTASITHNSPVAVLLIPEDYECTKIQKIVFATDLLGINKKMLISLLDFAEQNDSEIYILNVYKETKPDSTSFEEHIDGYLGDIKHRYYYIQNNSIVDGITQFVEDYKADQLVILNRRDSLVERLFHTSMTKRLTTHTKRPMMILHD